MMSIIEQVNYNPQDDAAQRRCLPCLAPANAAVFRATRELAAACGRARTVAGAVSRVASDRTWASDPDGRARRNARLRRFERDGVGRPPRIARSYPSPTVGC